MEEIQGNLQPPLPPVHICSQFPATCQTIKGEDEQEKLLGVERDVYVCVHAVICSCSFLRLQEILLKSVQIVLWLQLSLYPEVSWIS